MAQVKNSFEQFSESAPRQQPVIIAGIIVLVLAMCAAIAAGYIAGQRRDQSLSQPTTVTITAVPESARQQNSEAETPPPGRYEGQLSSTSGEPTSWQAVFLFTERDAMVVYPASECTALLEPTGNGTYKATPLTSSCTSGGSWHVELAETGLLKVDFSTPAGEHAVTGILSYAG